MVRRQDGNVIDVDLRPERRERLAAELRAALTAAIPDSQAELRGSLGSGTADPYSDIDLAWMVPDDMFAAAVESAAPVIQTVGTVSSLRSDPDLATSDRRRLIFFRLAGLPLFWRVDLDIRAASVGADNSYDDANPAARSEAGWSRPASAIENAVAAIKASVRGQPSTADSLLLRGYQRIGLDAVPAADLPSSIIRLADSCAAIEPGLTALASQVRQAVRTFARAGLVALCQLNFRHLPCQGVAAVTGWPEWRVDREWKQPSPFVVTRGAARVAERFAR